MSGGHVEVGVIVVLVDVLVLGGSFATRSATNESTSASTSPASPVVAQPPRASMRAYTVANRDSTCARQVASGWPLP